MVLSAIGIEIEEYKDMVRSFLLLAPQRNLMNSIVSFPDSDSILRTSVCVRRSCRTGRGELVQAWRGGAADCSDVALLHGSIQLHIQGR